MKADTPITPLNFDRSPRLSLRAVAAMLGISHTKVRRILAGQASLPDLMRYGALVRALAGSDDAAWGDISGQQAGSQRTGAGEAAPPPARQQPGPAFLTVHPDIARALVKALQDDEGTLVLDVPQLARLMGHHPRTVRRWIQAGLLPARRTGRRYYILVADAADLLAREGVIPMEAISRLRHITERRLTRRDLSLQRRRSQDLDRRARG
jgi:excisionase family DNA binding protein